MRRKGVDKCYILSDNAKSSKERFRREKQIGAIYSLKTSQIYWD